MEAINELVVDGVLPGEAEGKGITLASLQFQTAHAQEEVSEEEAQTWWDEWGAEFGVITSQFAFGAFRSSTGRLD